MYGTIQCCESGIRYLFDPWIGDPGWVKYQDPESGSVMNNTSYVGGGGLQVSPVT
jgi:hypothetical protein